MIERRANVRGWLTMAKREIALRATRCPWVTKTPCTPAGWTCGRASCGWSPRGAPHSRCARSKCLAARTTAGTVRKCVCVGAARQEGGLRPAPRDLRGLRGTLLRPRACCGAGRIAGALIAPLNAVNPRTLRCAARCVCDPDWTGVDCSTHLLSDVSFFPPPSPPGQESRPSASGPAGSPPPLPPPSRTNWTRLVPPSVLTGHVSPRYSFRLGRSRAAGRRGAGRTRRELAGPSTDGRGAHRLVPGTKPG
jgi:hypothetical protein